MALVVAEICAQVYKWNIQTRQNGVVTSSQGGFNLSMTGGRTIRVLDVTFTPSETYHNLNDQQLMTFQGVQLGWVVDPVNKNVYVLKQDRRGFMCTWNKGWNNVDGGNVLPSFVLKVWKIDEATSQLPSESSSSGLDHQTVTLTVLNVI
ncbi:8432_t:CDS:2 [Paraglomus brasilianum]|uniref:8432_t:CDS:1 n=1 Tax=Paraglomus brasilianum TaxID=144538 RepID=A0A9N9DEK3_9GLOM|nr:8432_t:CDS:2 [Paraglomus brasilianum]